ncbi:hypothetical protein WBJ53_06225 [Spirosoma sp. SC4-14]|uniref:hypothetical protein n=1 Tax=Spirosoma sp. SC4-14 TaxID=3128900 RepID=UPI0030CDA5BD
MKTFVTAILVLSSSFVFAQKRNSINRNINDDGKTLSIRVNGIVDGQTIDYDRTFDVSDLSKTERDALRHRILDSLNVGTPDPPRPPRAPAAPREPRAPRPPREPRLHSESITMLSSDNVGESVNGADHVAMAVGGKNPYTKEVRYNANSGQLYLRYRFQRDGEDITYERKIDAHNKSKEERQRLIEGIEKEIGVPAKSRK